MFDLCFITKVVGSKLQCPRDRACTAHNRNGLLLLPAQAAYEAKQAVLAAWLDGESDYRLEIEKENEAKVFFLHDAQDSN